MQQISESPVTDLAPTIVEAPKPRVAAARPSAAYIPTLDGLRGLAILAVFVYHEALFAGPAPATALDRAVRAVTDLGWSGVDLFFVLSGFLITGILVDAKGGEHYFRTFYARRVLRIFPAYYAFLFLYFVVRPHLPGGHYDAVPIRQQLWAWGYLTNVLHATHGWDALPKTIDHFWSLAIEEQFYLVWPLVVLLLSRRALAIACALAIVAAFLLRLDYITAHQWDAARVLTQCRMDNFAVGASLALVLRTPGGSRQVAQWSWPIAGLAALCIILLAVVAPGDFGAVSAVYLAIAVFSGALIGVAMTTPAKGVPYRVLGRGPLRFIGRYSYALYIVHQPVILGLMALGLSPSIVHPIAGSVFPQQLAFGLIAGLVSLAAALASWYLIERPFLALKRYVPYASPAPRPTGQRALLAAAPR